MSCTICQGTGWEITDAGAKKCQCRKQAATEQRQFISTEAAVGALKALDALAFFPKEVGARMAIGDAVRGMCPSVEALQYLVRMAIQHYTTWDECGVPGLRQIVCTKFRPADGIEASPTKRFPEGLPSETKRDPLALPPGARKMLPAGHVVTADTETDRAVQKVAELKTMPKAPVLLNDRFAKTLRDIVTPPRDRPERPAPTPQIITQADIDRELRDKRARELMREAAGEKELA